MAFNLIDATRGLFTNELIGKAAGMLKESEAGIQKAIGGIVPSVFTGVLQKAASGDGQGILNMAKDAMGSFSMSNLGGLISSGSGLLSKGSELLKNIFGDKLNNVTNMISGFAGIKESSATSLLSIAGPAAIGVLGKHASETNMGSTGLLSFLNSQKENIMNALPSGLNLAGALGLGSLTTIGTKLSGALASVTGGVKDTTAKVAHMAESAAEKASGGMRWLLPLLLAILVVGLIWYFAKGCNGTEKNEAVAAMDSTIKPVDTVAPSTVAPERASMKVKLPNGAELNAFKGGIEDQLVTFLNDPNSKPGKDVWFDFDNLNFKTNSSEVTDESLPQIENIVAILKAYPKLKIKIGGYTDKIGDSTANMKLSTDRAKSVVAVLATKGGDKAQVTGAEGYGSQFAKAAADAPDEERKKDRRISVSVRAK